MLPVKRNESKTFALENVYWIYLTISTPFKKGGGEIVKQIKIVDFSANQNAAKLELSIENTSANLLLFYRGGDS